MICVQKTILGTVIYYQIRSEVWIIITGLAYEVGYLSHMSFEYVLTCPNITIIKNDDEKLK